MKKHVKISIYGKVQGVFYRKSAKEKALECGIVGYVRNGKNGSVSIEAEGGEEELKKFISWCVQGSKNSRVERVESVFSQKIVGYENFKIIF